MADYFLRSRVTKTSRSSSSSSSSSTRAAGKEPPPSLPDDLLIEILKRLPLKSLVRFTCICKSWFSLIISPSFISTVANFNYSNSNRIEKSLLFRESINIHLVSYRTKFPVYDRVNLVKQTEYKCPFGRKHFVVSSADGLVCLFDFYSKDPIATPLILWNPSIKRADRVAAPSGCSSALEFTPGGFPKLIFGFGFDLVSGDYKAVRVAYFKRGQRRLNGTSFHTYVYCVGTGVWKDLGLCGVLHNVITIRWRGVCLNGVIHWVCNVIVNGGFRKLILTLKLENAEFGEIQLPKELVDVLNLRVVMVPRANKKVLGVVHILENELSLWVMEEYAVVQSWVKLLRVTFGSMIMNDMNVLVLSDHVVLVKNMFDSWVYYDHGKERMHSVKTIQNGHDFVDTYLESLILVGHKTKILKEVKQQ